MNRFSCTLQERESEYKRGLNKLLGALKSQDYQEGWKNHKQNERCML